MDGLPIALVADAFNASFVMRIYVTPIVIALCALASLACAFFLVNGGIQYITSTGKPEKLEDAKRIIRNALIGLILVLAAGTLTAILHHAYASTGANMTNNLPPLAAIQPTSPEGGAVGVLIDAIVGLLRNVIGSIGEPFVNALNYFTSGTPLMGDNSSVFNLWLAIVGITDVLFVLAVVLLGFHIMSFATFGFDEIEFKHLLPQLGLVFLLINTSIFAIDSIISLSNAMIEAVHSSFSAVSIWDLLAKVTKQSTNLGLSGLLVMMAFLVLTVMLLVYYVGRLITLYLGAVLSPLILLLWLIPAFKDFVMVAFKTYLTTIFVLFVHVVILELAASILSGLLKGDTSTQPNSVTALLVGLATVVTLLKTQGVMKEFSYAASAPRAARELGGQFIRGVSYMRRTGRTAGKLAGEGAGMVKSTRAGRAGGQTPIKPRSSSMGSRALPKSKPQAVAPLKTGQTRRAEG